MRPACHRNQPVDPAVIYIPAIRSRVDLGTAGLFRLSALVVSVSGCRAGGRRIFRLRHWDFDRSVLRRRMGRLGRMGMEAGLGKPHGDREQQLHPSIQFQRARTWPVFMEPRFGITMRSIAKVFHIQTGIYPTSTGRLCAESGPSKRAGPHGFQATRVRGTRAAARIRGARPGKWRTLAAVQIPPSAPASGAFGGIENG